MTQLTVQEKQEIIRLIEVDKPLPDKYRSSLFSGKYAKEKQQLIDFKDVEWALEWMEIALNKEKEKYTKCPVVHDMVPGHMNVQGWGYVVAGYFLVEQAVKLLLHLRGKQPSKTHILSDLFSLLSDGDKNVLGEYYRDFKCCFEGTRAFPFAELDDFITNLDGGKDSKGRYVGSFDWRYFLIEEMQGNEMPTVSVELLHEIVYGLVCIIMHDVHGSCDPARHTCSWRRHRERSEKYRDWLAVGMNSAGWNAQEDGLEVVWGPDYQDRYDFFIFKEGKPKSYFSSIPKDHELQVKDRRAEVNAFDAEEGFRGIGVKRYLPRVR